MVLKTRLWLTSTATPEAHVPTTEPCRSPSLVDDLIIPTDLWGEDFWFAPSVCVTVEHEAVY
jgi:hypothetical protein